MNRRLTPLFSLSLVLFFFPLSLSLPPSLLPLFASLIALTGDNQH